MPAQTTRDQTRDEARARLQRFFTAWFLDYRHPDPPAVLTQSAGLMDGLTEPGLREAAEVVLRAVQQELLRLESPVEPQQARLLVRERLWAITALIHLDGHKSAKETLLELTDGAPLTICMGDVCRIRNDRWKKKSVMTTVGDVGITVPGCHAIFPDALRTGGGEMWPGWCSECRSHSRKPHRAEARAVVQRINAFRRGGTTYEAIPRLLIEPDMARPTSR